MVRNVTADLFSGSIQRSLLHRRIARDLTKDYNLAMLGVLEGDPHCALVPTILYSSILFVPVFTLLT